MGPAVNESQLDTVLDYISIGKAEGAKLVAGGRRLTGKAYDKGWFVSPTVFGDGNRKMRIAREEIFGAVTVVIPVGSLEEAIDVANDSDYGLSSAIFTQDVNKAFTAMRDLEAGIFYVNLPTIGAETHLPFGGVKQTGNGHREAGTAGLDVFSEWKSIYVDYSGKIQKAQIDVPDQPVVKTSKR
jgi:aldehyde dehydrogenase (NAD+)